MIEFLQRVLNAQIVVTLLAMILPSAMRAANLIPPDTWERAFIAASVTFIGGGMLKDGLLAIANKQGGAT